MQKLQKQYHNKHTKLKNYTPDKKIWLNSKYIRTKQNRKLKVKFFRLFRILYPIGKQAYKLELPKKWRIHNIFYESLLEQDITKKGRVDNIISRLDFESDGNSKKYKFEVICNNKVYTKELDSD